MLEINRFDLVRFNKKSKMALESFRLAGIDIKQPKPGSVADAQMSATADWSPMGDVYMK